MKNNESSEMYLETILILSHQLPVVRSVDVANELGFKKSSVTDSGKEIAEMIYSRHQLLTDCLVKLGVDEAVAAEDACRIEHVISEESINAIRNHIKNI